MHSVSPSPVFAFSGKADTLQQLAPLLSTGKVLPLHRFTVAQWREDWQAVIAHCQAFFGDEPLIVRSSCLAEDRDGHSGAGMYASVLDVCGGQALGEAIKTVIASYGLARERDEVLVQQMARGVLASGVAMTRDPETGLPYYVVDYVPGASTDGVTTGNETVHAFVSLGSEAASEPAELPGLFALLEEVQVLTGRDALDIEFAITVDGPLLFQVRPMTADGPRNASALADAQLRKVLEHEVSQLEELICKQHHLRPTSTAFLGLMPDWNPAEMIGTKPRALAYSLYKELITDLNWASARFRYGYRDLRRKPLMYQVGGSPYICIAHSIESFIPASVPQDVAERVVEQCGEYLAMHPHLHDKIEFAIIPTCFTPELTSPDAAAALPALRTLSTKQHECYLNELRQLTEHIISPSGPFFSDLTRLPSITDKVQSLMARQPRGESLQRMRNALSAANVVAEVFAGAARAAFVGTAIIKSLETAGVVSAGFIDHVTGGINSIGREMASDFQTLHKDDFLKLHGHVRPGTYDIRVARYDETPESYFDWQRPLQRPPKSTNGLTVSRTQVNAMQQAFDQCGLNVSAEQFLQFAQAAIASREKLKYLYAAFVSDVLRSLCDWGEVHGLDRDQLSFAQITDFTSGYADIDRKRLHQAIAHNRSRWYETQLVRTPSIICQPQDLFGHRVHWCNPNFITRSATHARVAHVLPGQLAPDIEGCIVLIENADPGFDWIFTHRIAGFITAYGGENSHMSIRAREFAIPAAIGVGDTRFKTLLAATSLLLDCAERRIQVLA